MPSSSVFFRPILPQELQTAGVELQAALRSLPAPLYLTQQSGTQKPWRTNASKNQGWPGNHGTKWRIVQQTMFHCQRVRLVELAEFWKEDIFLLGIQHRLNLHTYLVVSACSEWSPKLTSSAFSRRSLDRHFPPVTLGWGCHGAATTARMLKWSAKEMSSPKTIWGWVPSGKLT